MRKPITDAKLRATFPHRLKDSATHGWCPACSGGGKTEGVTFGDSRQPLYELDHLGVTVYSCRACDGTGKRTVLAEDFHTLPTKTLHAILDRDNLDEDAAWAVEEELDARHRDANDPTMGGGPTAQDDRWAAMSDRLDNISRER